MSQLTQFQLDVLDQLASGPAAGTLHTENEELHTLATTGMVEVIPVPSTKLFAVTLTDAGLAFCRNSGSNLVN